MSYLGHSIGNMSMFAGFAQDMPFFEEKMNKYAAIEPSTIFDLSPLYDTIDRAVRADVPEFGGSTAHLSVEKMV